MLGYYEGGGLIKKLAATPGRGRELYEALCRFVKGTYQPSGILDRRVLTPGRNLLPASQPASAPSRGAGVSPAIFEWDIRRNLALQARGAKISGCVRDPKKPGLAPENIIDGAVTFYDGGGGYGYFTIPGALTIELAAESMVAKTQLQLWALDDRAFRYRIETSRDGHTWELAADKAQADCRGLQVDAFPPRSARFVRLTGLAATANANFQIVEFEIYPR